MDEQTAKNLLSEIQTAEKQAFPGFGGPKTDWKKVKQTASETASKDRPSQILQSLLLAGATGAGLRGAIGLSRMNKEVAARPPRIQDMEILLPAEKEEEEEKLAESFLDRAMDKLPIKMGPEGGSPNATHNTGVPYYIPAMMLGLPAAGVLGWKGMDAIFDKQRKLRAQSKVDKAKKEYEEELLGSYKQGSTNFSDELDQVFNKFEKAASFSNMSGQLKGLLATYAALSAPAAYMFVDDKLKKNSQKAILEKAIKERSRRAAQQQPTELYATPKPVEVPAEEEEDN
tara:strand:- start:1327 stop:2184 length:858 start_codon:yes stop_codon:yes gene_type:complete